MKSNTSEQAGQREAMTLQLAQMKRQNDLAREQFLLSIRPMFRFSIERLPAVSISFRNAGFGKAIIYAIEAYADGSGDRTEDLQALFDALLSKHNLKGRCSPVHAPNLVGDLIEINDGREILAFAVNRHGMTEAEGVRYDAFYKEVSRIHLDVEFRDIIGNAQPTHVVDLGLPEVST